MDLEENYEINRTADFIHGRNFTRVALQFPDELLKDSMSVVRALRGKLSSLVESVAAQDTTYIGKEVGLFVMADATYGSCCVDEVGASHIDADCVIHYGHTCLSPTSTLPAFFVFGKASIDISNCAERLSHYASNSSKSIVILFGLEYAHAIPHIKELVTASPTVSGCISDSKFHFAGVKNSGINLPEDHKKPDDIVRPIGNSTTGNNLAAPAPFRHSIGGLIWDIPDGHKMENYVLVWIGSDNSAFANVVMTFSECEIVRYDTKQNCMVTDLSQQRRILKRRYYLVEKAKDANIVGILVGTLGVAGYLDMIHQMKDLITGVGKKAYTLVMGRPNPAKLANFPECDVFIYVSCAQTALLDSKEFLAPIITPFEAMLAFNRGSQWTGSYIMDFQNLVYPTSVEVRNHSEEARFSFIEGRYVEESNLQENLKDDEEGVLAITNATSKALELRDKDSTSLIKGTIKSGAEYFATRSYRGLEMHADNSMPEAYLIGRTGKASGYTHEKSELANS